jgi:hypothetical protein
MLDRIHAAARDAGRDPASIGVDVQVIHNWVPEDGWVDFAARWRALGATHLSVSTLGLGSSSADEHLGVLGRLREELVGAGLIETG